MIRPQDAISNYRSSAPHILGVLILLSTAVVGCGLPAFGSTKTIVVTATPAPTPSATAQSVPSVTAGSTAPVGAYTDVRTNIWASVNNPVIDPRADAKNPLPAGYVFLILHATIHNGAATEGYFNPIDFDVVDENGKSYTETGSYPDRDGPELGFGPNETYPGTTRIAAGETKTGALGYRIPVSTKAITVTWSDGHSIQPPAELARYQLK